MNQVQTSGSSTEVSTVSIPLAPIFVLVNDEVRMILDQLQSLVRNVGKHKTMMHRTMMKMSARFWALQRYVRFGSDLKTCIFELVPGITNNEWKSLYSRMVMHSFILYLN